MVSLKTRAFFAIFSIVTAYAAAPVLGDRLPPKPSKNTPDSHKSASCPRNGVGHDRPPDEGLFPMLNIALLSASIGKYFLNRKMNISTECHETAMTAVQLWQALPILEKVNALIQLAFYDVVNDVRSSHGVKNPVAVVCEKIENRFGCDAELSDKYWSRKKWLRKNGVNKVYTKLLHAPKTSAGANQLISEEFDDPVIGMLLAHITFANQLNKTKAASPEFYWWAKAVLALAKDEKLSNSVQLLYDKTRQQTADNIVSPHRKQKPANSVTPIFETEMMNGVVENFGNDTFLATYFQKAVEKLKKIN